MDDNGNVTCDSNKDNNGVANSTSSNDNKEVKKENTDKDCKNNGTASSNKDSKPKKKRQLTYLEQVDKRYKETVEQYKACGRKITQWEGVKAEAGKKLGWQSHFHDRIHQGISALRCHRVDVYDNMNYLEAERDIAAIKSKAEPLVNSTEDETGFDFSQYIGTDFLRTYGGCAEYETDNEDEDEAEVEDDDEDEK